MKCMYILNHYQIMKQSEYIRASANDKTSPDRNNEDIVFTIGKNNRSSFMQVRIDNGPNRSIDVPTAQHKPRRAN